MGSSHACWAGTRKLVNKAQTELEYFRPKSGGEAARSAQKKNNTILANFDASCRIFQASLGEEGPQPCWELSGSKKKLLADFLPAPSRVRVRCSVFPGSHVETRLPQTTTEECDPYQGICTIDIGVCVVSHGWAGQAHRWEPIRGNRLKSEALWGERALTKEGGEIPQPVLWTNTSYC